MLRTILTASIVLASIVFAPALASAQQTTTDTLAARCFVAGKAFSPGATVRASSGVTVCGADGSWSTTDKPASGCFFADNFYSAGATSGVSNTKNQIETCDPDGTWSAATVKDSP